MRRNKLQIIHDILRISIKGANKTKIVYLANLNFKTASPYLDLLAKNHLIDVRENEHKMYTTTEKGILFIKNFEDAQKYLDEY